MLTNLESNLALISVLNLVWYVCIFFVPFVLIGIGKNAKQINHNLEILITLQLKNIPDENLTQKEIMKKYQIYGPDSGPFSYQGRAFKDLDNAIHAAKDT